MRIKRLLVSACIVPVVAVAIQVVAAPSALAIPSGCSIFYGSGTTAFNSICTSGTGQHRIRIVVKHFNPAIGLIPCEGPWAAVGAVSSTGCPPHQIVEQTIELR
jgi:hypothetical protein